MSTAAQIGVLVGASHLPDLPERLYRLATQNKRKPQLLVVTNGYTAAAADIKDITMAYAVKL